MVCGGEKVLLAWLRMGVGATSNLYAYPSKVDMPLAIAMTAVSMVVAVVAMPVVLHVNPTARGVLERGRARRGPIRAVHSSIAAYTCARKNARIASVWAAV